MSNSTLHDRSDGIGYLVPSFLSICIHILFACGLWAGANVHQSSNGKGSLENNAPPPALPATLQKASAISPLAGEEDPRGKALHAGRESNANYQPAIPSRARTLANSRGKAKQLAALESHGDQNTKQKFVRTVAKASKDDTSQRRKIAQASKNKKTQTVRAAKKGAPMRTRNEADVAESKKLKRLREAELRRISDSVS